MHALPMVSFSMIIIAGFIIIYAIIFLKAQKCCKLAKSLFLFCACACVTICIFLSIYVESTLSAKVAVEPSVTQNEYEEDLGSTVYYTKSGRTYHLTPECPYLSRSKNIIKGTTKTAADAGIVLVCKKCKELYMPEED